jgi:hypothetical protein
MRLWVEAYLRLRDHRRTLLIACLLALAPLLFFASRRISQTPSILGKDHQHIVSERYSQVWRLEESGRATLQDRAIDSSFVILDWRISYEWQLDLPLVSRVPLWLDYRLFVEGGGDTRAIPPERADAAIAAIWERLESGEPGYFGLPHPPRVVAMGPSSYVGPYAVGVLVLSTYVLAVASALLAIRLWVPMLYRHTRRARRARRNECERCGYARIGINADTCPECGSGWRAPKQSSAKR